MALQLDGMNRIIDTLIHAPTHGPQFLCVDPSIHRPGSYAMFCFRLRQGLANSMIENMKEA